MIKNFYDNNLGVRPGFKSNFSSFINRTPFTYGVKEFDSIIQTETRKDSWVLN